MDAFGAESVERNAAQRSSKTARMSGDMILICRNARQRERERAVSYTHLDVYKRQGACIRNCAQCTKMFGTYFMGQKCVDFC
ncbi:hypothetical protein DBV15_03259, partial [Temnothorax longispinosus]